MYMFTHIYISHIYIYIYIYIYICIYIHGIYHCRGFCERAIEGRFEWNLNPRPLNSLSSKLRPLQLSYQTMS